MKQLLRPLFYRLLDLLASDIRDVNTGERICRAVLVPWRGRIFLLGREVGGASLLPRFAAQNRLTFWKVELGFTEHSPPDFPHEPRS